MCDARLQMKYTAAAVRSSGGLSSRLIVLEWASRDCAVSGACGPEDGVQAKLSTRVCVKQRIASLLGSLVEPELRVRLADDAIRSGVTDRDDCGGSDCQLESPYDSMQKR